VPRVCTAAFSDAKQLIIARGVDPDLMTSKLDTTNQLNSSVTTGDAECCAAVTKIDGVKLQKRDLLRVLSRAARVAIKHEWAKEAEKAQRLASGTNRAGSRGQITQQERSAIRASASANPFDNTVDEIHRWDPAADPDADDEAEDEEVANDEDRPLDCLNGNTEITFAGSQGDAPGPTASGRLQFAEKFIGATSTKNSGLECVLCLMDPIVPFDKKKLVYSLAKLDQHLTGNFHSREKQIMRAFHIDAVGTPPKATCPLCGKAFVAKQLQCSPYRLSSAYRHCRLATALIPHRQADDRSSRHKRCALLVSFGARSRKPSSLPSSVRN
jgi:hypothetical protein